MWGWRIKATESNGPWLLQLPIHMRICTAADRIIIRVDVGCFKVGAKPSGELNL